MPLDLDSSVTIPLPDGGGITEELIVLNSFVTMSQKGLDPHDPETAGVWSARLASCLNEKYKPPSPLTPTVAWLVADAVVRRLREMQENFTLGLKSPPSTGSTLGS